jgi:hypothetical protein
MAANLNRTYEEVMRELFIGKDAALKKYSKVRHILYKMHLRKNGAALSKSEKAYFSHRFMNGQRFNKANRRTFNEAISRLKYANGIDQDGNQIHSGCYERCFRLVDELNAALSRAGLQPVSDNTAFIDWLTFSYETPTDDKGIPINAPGCNFETRIFHDEENRQDFTTEVRNLLREHKRMSMQDIWRIVDFKRRRATTFTKGSQ